MATEILVDGSSTALAPSSHKATFVLCMCSLTRGPCLLGRAFFGLVKTYNCQLPRACSTSDFVVVASILVWFACSWIDFRS